VDAGEIAAQIDDLGVQRDRPRDEGDVIESEGLASETTATDFHHGPGILPFLDCPNTSWHDN